MYSLELHQCVEMTCSPALVPEISCFTIDWRKILTVEMSSYLKQGKISTGRVVAHGGDSVEITGDGELRVNGSIVIETNVFYKTYPYDKKKVNYPLSLKKDEVFLLCDYREGGRDSRYFGAVSKKEIKGKVITILRRSDL